MNLLSNIERSVFGQPWAVTQDTLEIISGIVTARLLNDEVLSGVTIFGARALRNDSQQQEVEMIGDVAMVPVSGVLMRKANLFQKISGAMSYQQVQDRFNAAMESDAKTVCMLCDSPGGEVIGCEETANAIFEARQASTKQVIAFTQGQMCSAMYFLASQCDKVFATPDSWVGSVGVIAKVVDTSRADKNTGKDAVIVRSGPNKQIGTGPVTDSQVQELRDLVSEYAQTFWSAVERGRNITLSDDVKSGKVYTGSSAMKAGLVDETMTLDQLLKRFGGAA